MPRKRSPTPFHVSYTNTITCPMCGRTVFIPLQSNSKKGQAKVIFKCIFCDKRIETVIVQ